MEEQYVATTASQFAPPPNTCNQPGQWWLHVAVRWHSSTRIVTGQANRMPIESIPTGEYEEGQSPPHGA